MISASSESCSATTSSVEDEWWIPDLARKLGVIPQKVHYWVKQGWVHSRRTPSGKHLIVWADKDEIRRLTTTGETEELLDRRPAPRVGHSQEPSRPIATEADDSWRQRA